MKKGLFDFVKPETDIVPMPLAPIMSVSAVLLPLAVAESTRVEVKDLIMSKVTELHVCEKILSVCLTKGGINKCMDCLELAMVQETTSSMFPFRIFCKKEKCVKPAVTV